MADSLHALTALGERAPLTHTVGSLRIEERFDVALASVASRRGRAEDVARAAAAAGIPLPVPATWQAGPVFSTFWVAPEMWFVEAPFGSHEDFAAHLVPLFGGAASVTEQTDAWVRFELTDTAMPRLMERLCNVDFVARPDGFATRTVIEHLGCYLIRKSSTAVTLYGPRSSARSLLHALEVTAESLI